MIEIKDLLTRFDNILLSEQSKKEAVRRVLSQTVNLEISSNDIEIKNGTVYLKILTILKVSFILIHILSQLTNQ